MAKTMLRITRHKFNFKEKELYKMASFEANNEETDRRIKMLI
jgi:hypothetical protein